MGIKDDKDFAEIVGDALRAVQPALNIGGWEARHAEAIGKSAKAFEKWRYGVNPPEAENLLALMIELPEFANELLHPHGCCLVPLDATDAMEAARNKLGIAEIGAIIDRVRGVS